MPRKTKAQLAAEAAEAEALAAAEADDNPEELDSLLEAGYEAGDEEENWSIDEDDLAALRDAEEAGDWEAFKADVTIECTKVEKKSGKDSADPYLNVTWVVTEGPHEKAHIFDIIMLRGKGLGFAKKKLNQLGLSVDGLAPKAFLGLVVTAKTKIDRGKDGYDDKTVIQKYTGQVGVTASEDLPE